MNNAEMIAGLNHKDRMALRNSFANIDALLTFAASAAWTTDGAVMVAELERLANESDPAEAAFFRAAHELLRRQWGES